MLALATQVDWVDVWRSGGLQGVIAILAVVGIVAGAKWFKSMMETTLADARKERDAARLANEAQATANRVAVETQASRFLESLKIRDDIQEKGFDEILRELRSTNPRRK